MTKNLCAVLFLSISFSCLMSWAQDGQSSSQSLMPALTNDPTSLSLPQNRVQEHIASTELLSPYHRLESNEFSADTVFRSEQRSQKERFYGQLEHQKDKFWKQQKKELQRYQKTIAALPTAEQRDLALARKKALLNIQLVDNKADWAYQTLVFEHRQKIAKMRYIQKQERDYWKSIHNDLWSVHSHDSSNS